MTNKISHGGFTGLGIAPRLLDVIDSLKFKVPTPIQSKSIPVGIEGKDLIAIAQTGTGKTLAFGIPMIQRLAQIKGGGLILLPTRELALQVDKALGPFNRAFAIRTAVIIGGESISHQRRALEKGPRIIIATPGRLLDLLEQGLVTMAEVQILVFDEADRMLDMGFAPQINRIMSVMPKKRQTLLFSATIPSEIVAIAQRHMELPIRVEIAPSGTAAEKVIQELFFIAREAKTRLLEVMLQQYPGPALVFTRTKHGARKLSRQVRGMGHASAEIHSDRSLPQRKEALEGFKTGKYRVLVATDIAARGIDVTGIEIVINYDLPSNSEDYVHRIGRTGRAGRAGRAVSFASLDQRSDVRKIEQVMRTALPVKPVPSLPPERPRPAHEHGYAPAALPRQPQAEQNRPAFGRAPKDRKSNRFRTSKRR